LSYPWNQVSASLVVPASSQDVVVGETCTEAADYHKKGVGPSVHKVQKAVAVAVAAVVVADAVVEATADMEQWGPYYSWDDCTHYLLVVLASGYSVSHRAAVGNSCR
jgi:hypothetical protein